MTKEEIAKQVIRELNFIYEQSITVNTNFCADLNMDPLDMAELFADMEQRLGVKLDGEPETVEELANEVWRAKQ